MGLICRSCIALRVAFYRLCREREHMSEYPIQHSATILEKINHSPPAISRAPLLRSSRFVFCEVSTHSIRAVRKKTVASRPMNVLLGPPFTTSRNFLHNIYFPLLMFKKWKYTKALRKQGSIMQSQPRPLLFQLCHDNPLARNLPMCQQDTHPSGINGYHILYERYKRIIPAFYVRVLYSQ